MRTDLSVRSVELFVVHFLESIAVRSVVILSVHTTDIFPETEHISPVFFVSFL